MSEGMKREYLTKLLQSNKFIEDLKIPQDGEGNIDREYKFKVRGVEYKIIWFCNSSTLFIGDVEIPFYGVDLSGTWPNEAKTNLQFHASTKTNSWLYDTVCIIPVEFWDKPTS